ncbi:MAG: hypothetical protein JWN54_2579 [Mycobacterium sp.]|nr:hypothetical protein [Mycobacterium sp.]
MSTDDALDGNAVAGALGAVFASDPTVAIGQCAGCGRRAPLADTRAYLRAPGVVLRCRGCDGVLLRLVTTPERSWLDLRGLTWLELPGTE